jgi:hypothetical protein
VTDVLVPRIVAASDAALEGTAEGDARSQIEGVRERLLEPLRISIGGRIKAGKSTLVNALLGRQVAATDVGECTKVVAEYRYGLQDKVEVVPREGEPWTLTPTRDGAIPADIGAPADDVAQIVVSMTVRDPLERMTIVDTPGLFSLNEQYSANTKRFLGVEQAEIDVDSRRAVSQTDGLVYLMPHPSENDREFLETFQALYPESRIGANNVVGVLSKIDMLGSGRGDPWPQARKVAGNYERKLRSTVGRVVPVAGLLAETSVGDAFTEGEMHQVRALAQLEPAQRELALESVEAFRSSPEIDLDAERRERLLGFFGLFGLRESLRLVDDGVRSAAVLVERLRELSGIGDLRRILDQTLRSRSDPLRAHRALEDLERVCFRHRDELGTAGARLRNELEAIRLDPRLHFIDEVDVLRGVDSGTVSLPREYERELVRVAKSITADEKLGLDGGSPATDRAELALQRVAAWQRLENDPSTSPQQARAARVIRESFEQIYFAAREPSAGSVTPS